MLARNTHLITSRNHPSIRRLRSLHRREDRDRAGLALIEGLRLLSQAVERRVRFETLVLAPELLTSPYGRKLAHRLRRSGARCLEVSRDVFHSLALCDDPQGIAAVVPQEWQPIQRADPRDGLCWIALGALQSPGNLGTIIRTAEAVGAGGIVFLDPAADPYDASTIRASMGALFGLGYVRATLSEFAAWKRRTGCLVVGTSPSAEEDYHAVPYPEPCVLMMGWERRGLSPQETAQCDRLVRIPMVGRGDSLNLAIATGVMLYEVFNQRRAGAPLPNLNRVLASD